MDQGVLKVALNTESVEIQTVYSDLSPTKHAPSRLACQEYLGSYATDPQSGRLVFQEGALVEAVRKGHWIVLDELNLAPSDVLEALNRLLDDNRELFVPELQVRSTASHRCWKSFEPALSAVVSR